MTLGTVGWLCPKCGAICSPYQDTCAKCAPKNTITYGGTVTGWSGTITLGPVRYEGLGSGTVLFSPPKTDAQKLEEAQKALDKANCKIHKYSEWADKIIDFYGRLNELAEELDELTNEPGEIEDD